LQSCNNWCGISLLNVVGKVFTRVIQNRLQVIAEDCSLIRSVASIKVKDALT